MLTRLSIFLHTLNLCLLLALASFLAGMVGCGLLLMSGTTGIDAWDWILFMAFVPLPLLFLIWGWLERRAVRRGARVRALPAVLVAFCLVAMKMPLFPPSGLPHYLVLTLATTAGMAFLLATGREMSARRNERRENQRESSRRVQVTV